jgi:hypothetical protein
MDRAGAATYVTNAIATMGGSISQLETKLMTYDTYLAVDEPGVQFLGVVVPGSLGLGAPQVQPPDPSAVAAMNMHADDPVWVVAFSGTWYPQGNANGAGASPSGMIIVNAKTGLPGEIRWFRDSWPPGFDALPNDTSLPCVPS